MKLKDLLLEKPQDYVDGHIDNVDLLYRKKKYQYESHHDKKEGKMAKYDAKEIAQDSIAVFKMIDKDMDLPEWLEAKITKAADYMNSVKDYLTHHSDDSDNENQSQKENKKDDDEKWSGIYVIIYKRSSSIKSSFCCTKTFCKSILKYR